MCYVLVVDGGRGDSFALLARFCLFPPMLWIASFGTGRILRRVADQARAVTKTCLATPAFYVIGLLIVVVATTPSPSSLRDSSFWLEMTIWCVPSWLLTFLGFRRWRAVRDHNGPPNCAKCGYNLTGNISGICPECGTPIPGFNERTKQGVEIEP
jgi:hypothetical protein